MTAGDLTVGIINGIDELSASLTAKSVTLTGAAGETFVIVRKGDTLQWAHIVNA